MPSERFTQTLHSLLKCGWLLLYYTAYKNKMLELTRLMQIFPWKHKSSGPNSRFSRFTHFSSLINFQSESIRHDFSSIFSPFHFVYWKPLNTAFQTCFRADIHRLMRRKNENAQTAENYQRHRNSVVAQIVLHSARPDRVRVLPRRVLQGDGRAAGG